MSFVDSNFSDFRYSFFFQMTLNYFVIALSSSKKKNQSDEILSGDYENVYCKFSDQHFIFCCWSDVILSQFCCLYTIKRECFVKSESMKMTHS